MASLDPTALAAALPPDAVVSIATDGSNGITIAAPDLGMTYETQDQPSWFTPEAPATTPEQQLAYNFFQAALQQQMGADAYAAAALAGTLPTWTPGASLPT